MPKLKLRVESAIRGYLAGQLTDERLEEEIQAILDEFEGKRLLHQNIGQLVWQMEQEYLGRRSKFETLWRLLDQVSPRIREDLNRRLQRRTR